MIKKNVISSGQSKRLDEIPKDYFYKLYNAKQRHSQNYRLIKTIRRRHIIIQGTRRTQ